MQRNAIEKRSMLLAERREAMQKISVESSEPLLNTNCPDAQGESQKKTELDSSLEDNASGVSVTETAKTGCQKAQNEDQVFYEKLLQLGSAKQIGLFKQIDMDVQRTHPPQYEKLFDSPRISFVRLFMFLYFFISLLFVVAVCSFYC